MAKRLDLLPQPVVDEAEEAAEMEEMCDLVSWRTQKALEWYVTERLAGRVTTGTTRGLAAFLATAGQQNKRQPGPPSLRLRVLRSDNKVKEEEKAAEEMAQPPIKCRCVGREESQAPEAAAAA